MPINPLTAALIPILRGASASVSEYALIRMIEQSGFSFSCSDQMSNDLQLFRKHFLTMNALYQLQELFWEEGLRLQISALDIYLEPIADKSANSLPGTSSEQPLRDYYLDWSQFEKNGESEVKSLLDSFWKRYFSEDRRYAALTVLELSPKSGWQEIRRAYRHLAGKHHPDRGGDPERFKEIREAYELLACCHEK
ncbi:DNA-J related domain-containing protein [Motiliproteus sp. MSK22-1]|uniref:DNA-J related domain-containing protein n=1 Tax=Motiliproteus sp. MSK22-1 TaxID=1897630 RepID=UPI00097704B9|nr:hypothetical protein BGP75_01760 [Motiliproteus sp. MSK22-1]